MSEEKFEPVGYGAREFFGMPHAYVEDGGPVPEEKRERFHSKARVFRVYLNGRPRAAGEAGR